MEKKPDYNDEKIEKAVGSLIDCSDKMKGVIDADLSKELISKVEITVSALNDADNLMGVKKEIQDQIIGPVNNRLDKSTKSNILIGWVGISAAVIGIIISIAISIRTSDNINSLNTSLDGVNQQIGKNIEADIKIYANINKNIDSLNEDFGKAESQINKKNTMILESIDKNSNILTELKSKHEYKYTDYNWIGLGATPNLNPDLLKIPGSIQDQNVVDLLINEPETKNKD